MSLTSRSFAASHKCFEPCETVEIPLLGRVAAGMPYAAFPVDDTLQVPSLWAGKKVFALKVQGNSMIDEGIHNGDHIIVEPRENADNGQTVVAEVDGGVTVKRFYREADGSIRLQPANSELLPLVVRGQELRIIGIVVGVLRRLGFSERSRELPEPIGVEPHPKSLHKRPSHTSTDPESLELALNALDRQVEQWHVAVERAKRDRKLMKQVPSMAELGRDLEALRDWCARTSRPSLRRALLQEANRVMRRMQRFKGLVAVEVTDLPAR